RWRCRSRPRTRERSPRSTARRVSRCRRATSWSSSSRRGPVGTRELAGGKLLLDHPAEAVARLTLSNPERRNALDHDVLEALAEALPELDRGIEVRCVIVTGAGATFSAGYDIAEIADEAFEREAEALVAHPYH